MFRLRVGVRRVCELFSPTADGCCSSDTLGELHSSQNYIWDNLGCGASYILNSTKGAQCNSLGQRPSNLAPNLEALKARHKLTRFQFDPAPSALLTRIDP